MRSCNNLFMVMASAFLIVPSTGPAQQTNSHDRARNPDVTSLMQSRFHDMAGTWDVVIEYTMGEKKHTGKATCEAKTIMEGRFLQQDYRSLFQGKPYHVMQILGYDDVSQKTIEIKLDNLSSGILHNEGSASGDGKLITNAGEGIDPRTRQPYKLRTVTTIADADHFTLEWFRTSGEARPEKVVSMSHTRRRP